MGWKYCAHRIKSMVNTSKCITIRSAARAKYVRRTAYAVHFVRKTLRPAVIKDVRGCHEKAAGVFAIVLCGCSGSYSDWTAFVYPDIENIPGPEQAQNYTIGNYSSFEECQVAAINRLRSNDSQNGKSGDYMYGYKCSHRENLGGLLVCEEKRN